MYRMLKRSGQLLDQHGTVIEPVASPGIWRTSSPRPKQSVDDPQALC
jgi:hypothetical protein